MKTREMLYPDDLIYKFKKSEAEYSYTPLGQLNVNRFLQNKSCWRKPHPSSEEKVKSLIFADWTAVGWSRQKLDEVRNLVMTLLNDGCNLYLWQYGKVVPLTDPDIFLDASVRKCMSPICSVTDKRTFNDDKIANIAMTQQKLSSDEVQVIDDYWIQALIDQDFKRPRQVNISDIVNSKHELHHDMGKIISYLQQLSPAVEKINHDLFSYDGNCCLDRIKKKISSNIYTDYRSARLENDTASVLLKDKIIEIETLTLSHHELDKIENLELTGSRKRPPLMALNYILAHTKNIRKLKLVFGSLEDCSPDFQALETLEEFNLREVNLTNQYFSKLLSNNKNLRKFVMLNSQLSNFDPSYPYSISSSVLEEVTINYSVLTSAFLTMLVKNQIHLKTLDLSDSGIKDEIQDELNLIKLEKLELIDVSNIPHQILAINLYKLLVNAKNLKGLNISHQIIGDLPSELDLVSLEKLNINARNTSTENIYKLMNKSSKLKTLEIVNGDMHDLSGKFRLESLNDFKYKGKITAQLLEDMLANSPNLQKLDLYDCHINGEIFQDLNLENLDEVKLPSEISAINFEHILISAEHLKKLDLSNHKIFGEISQDFHLYSLEELILPKDISANNIRHIISGIKNPIKLDLHLQSFEGDKISNEMLDSLQLNKVKEIKFPGKVSANNLEHILKRAIDLKKISYLSNHRAGYFEIIGELSENLELRNLEEIDLPRDPGSKNLYHLLVNALKLKGLYLLEDSNLVDDLHLESLEYLEIIDGKHSARSLQHILSNAKNLQELNLLFGCEISGKIHSDLPLFSLQCFSCNTQISVEAIKAILANATNIKTLDLSQYAQDVDFLQSLSLESLEEFKSPKTGISLATLEHLLSNDNNLKMLYLYDWLEGEVSKPLYTHSLESLEINVLSAASLMDILYNATKLKILCLRIEKQDLLHDLRLYSLENMKLLSQVSAITLGHLLVNSRNLKTLELKEFKMTDEDLKTLQMLGHKQVFNKLTYINLTFSDLSIQHLLYLVSLAPHLESIRIEACKNISPDIVNLLKKKGIEVDYIKKHTFSNSRPAYSYSEDDIKIINNFEQGLPLEHFFDSTITNPILTESENTKPRQLRSDSVQTIDADTANYSTRYHLNQIFIGKKHTPHPSAYRFSVHHRLQLASTSVSVNKAFTLDNFSDSKEIDLQLSDINLPIKCDTGFSRKFSELSSDNQNIYYGKINLILDGNWQALPSLSCTEIMLEYHIDHPLLQHEIKYSERDNLYYIHALDNRSHYVNMEFILDTRMDEKSLAPENLRALVQHYLEFGEGALSFKGPCSGQQYLDAINHEKKGACRHRSIALMDAIQNHKQKFGLPDTTEARVILNDCHAFVEIRLYPDSSWMSFNLGGYESKLEINTDNFSEQLLTNEQKFIEQPGFEIVPETKNFHLEQKQQEIGGIHSFARQLETWEKSKPKPRSKSAYYMQLVNGERKKQLIEARSTKDVQALALDLENHCHHTGRPVYYIHSPDDLVCSAPYIERNGNRGRLKFGENGQGGRLHDFLSSAKDEANPHVLIVNYDNFDANDIVRLNSLLDDEPKADGTKINDTLVIGLINPAKPGCYQGEDFYSRFGGNVSICPYQYEEKNLIKENLQTIRFTINLFHAADWEERLLGRWIPKEDGLYLEEGLLKKALDSGWPIEIQNGLWEDPSFFHFWNRALTLPYIEANGEKFEISKSSITKTEGYDWENLSQSIVKCYTGLDHVANVINPGTLSEFFYKYDIKDGKLITLPGLIEENHDKNLHVNLTRTLNEDEWSELLTECKKYKVSLHCHLASSVILPNVLNKIPENLAQITPSPIVIESSDIEVSISQLGKEWKVIDVSELQGNDLLSNLSGETKAIFENDKEEMILSFSRKDCELKKALQNNEKIILRGKFSSELADSLAAELLKYPENLRLITSDASWLKFSGVKRHDVSLKEKCDALSAQFDPELISSLNTLESESFSKLRARLLCPQLKDPWDGLKGLSGGIKIKDIDLKNSRAIADEFENKRIHSILEILHESPFVFITGLSGVGKSTFIKDVFSKKYLQDEKKKVRTGKDQIGKWIKDKKEGPKLLFLDEANITTREWSEFNGLLNDPPGIMFEGEYHILSKEHKVIFAGNPLNYGGERKMAPLFENNGIALVFEPMPPEYIYEEILKPVFINTHIEKYSSEISVEILKAYKFLCECSQDEILISPRELQMIALMVLSHAREYPMHDINIVTKHFINSIARNLLAKSRLKGFDNEFFTPPLIQSIKQAPKDFVLTHSRKPLYQHLSDLLALREYRRENPAINPKKPGKDEIAKLYGGLGGIVIEGEPGIGKSELVTAHLLAHGYDEVKLDDKEIPEKAFYRMPVSMQFEEKEKLLLKAFDQGAIVIVDEINSAPMMESLLNDLLMHRKPNGAWPEKPGFMVIGTQNPITMAGRNRASTALKRRITIIDLPPYPEEELNSVLCESGLEPKYANILTRTYLDKLQQAKRESLSPTPTMRDLKRVCNKSIERIQNNIKYVKPEITISTAVGRSDPLISSKKYGRVPTKSAHEKSGSPSLTQGTENKIFQEKASSHELNENHRELGAEIKARIEFYKNRIKAEQKSFFWTNEAKIRKLQDKISVLKAAHRLLLCSETDLEKYAIALWNREEMHEKWNEGKITTELVMKVKKQRSLPLDWKEYKLFNTENKPDFNPEIEIEFMTLVTEIQSRIAYYHDLINKEKKSIFTNSAEIKILEIKCSVLNTAIDVISDSQKDISTLENMLADTNHQGWDIGNTTKSLVDRVISLKKSATTLHQINI